MDLDKNCWYWFTSPEEGDSWYPVFINSEGLPVLDGDVKHLGLLGGLILMKAEMPSSK